MLTVTFVTRNEKVRRQYRELQDDRFGKVFNAAEKARQTKH